MGASLIITKELCDQVFFTELFVVLAHHINGMTKVLADQVGRMAQSKQACDAEAT